jgi:hypothetical protein
MRRLNQLYDEALANAEAIQCRLVQRMRCVRSGIPSWNQTPDILEAAWKQDVECVDLSRKASIAWETVELRRQQLMAAKGAA